MICEKCKKELILKTVNLKYLEYEFSTELPCCPQCGVVYVSEELVNGKIDRVEKLLEEK